MDNAALSDPAVVAAAPTQVIGLDSVMRTPSNSNMDAVLAQLGGQRPSDSPVLRPNAQYAQYANVPHFSVRAQDSTSNMSTLVNHPSVASQLSTQLSEPITMDAPLTMRANPSTDSLNTLRRNMSTIPNVGSAAALSTIGEAHQEHISKPVPLTREQLLQAMEYLLRVSYSNPIMHIV